MRLLINQEAIDIKIEHETVLGEIIEGLEYSFKEHNNKIISMQVNDEFIALDGAEWKHIPLSDIIQLSIEVENKNLIRVQSLQTVFEYLSLLDHACRENQQIENLNEEDLKIVLETIDELCVETHTEHKPLKILLHYVCNSLQLFSGKNELEFKASSELVLTHIINILIIHICFYLNSDDKFQAINTQIKHLIEKGYIKTAELFIRGEEELALQFIISTHDVFLKWLYYLQEEFRNKKETPIAEQINPDTLNHSLTSFFEEQGEAIEVKDWISVGDLIEYEISPLILDYINALEHEAIL